MQTEIVRRPRRRTKLLTVVQPGDIHMHLPSHRLSFVADGRRNLVVIASSAVLVPLLLAIVDVAVKVDLQRRHVLETNTHSDRMHHDGGLRGGVVPNPHHVIDEVPCGKFLRIHCAFDSFRHAVILKLLHSISNLITLVGGIRVLEF